MAFPKVLPGILMACALPLLALDLVVYTLRIGDPAAHLADVRATIPTEGRARTDLLMATWTPGYYAVQDFAGEGRDSAWEIWDTGQTPQEWPREVSGEHSGSNGRATGGLGHGWALRIELPRPCSNQRISSPVY